MYEQISNLIGTLRDAGVLKNRDVVAALINFAQGLSDLDYRSHMLGELSVGLAATGEFDKAEQLGRLVENSEKGEFLRRVAEIEGRGDQPVRALQLFSEAREAAFLHRFPTQQALALAEIAVSLGALGKSVEADETWDSAIQLAMEAQHGGGTDGPEAAGVLLRAVERLCTVGRRDAAKSVAEAIIPGPIRDKAFHTIAATIRAS
jgi:hypothetical protein